jgi:hypothetical protein
LIFISHIMKKGTAKKKEEERKSQRKKIKNEPREK